MAVNIKMGVDIGNFTAGIKEGQQILKGLNAEMKASEAEFKATGNAEQKLTSQTKTLNSQLNIQKGIADQAKQALDAMTEAGIKPTDAAYQKMYATMMNAQAGMNEVQAQLNDMSGGAKDAAKNVTDLETGLSNVNKKISLEQVTSAIGKITDGMEKAAKVAARLGKAIVTEVLGAGSWADELKTTATAYGITPEELQRMQKTAEIIDTDADTILSAKQRMAKNKDKLSDLMGISTEGKSMDDAFWEAGEAIMAMTDAFEQEEAAQKVFGKGWRDLVPVFTAGREEYERLNSTWKVVSSEELDNLTKMDDQYQTLKADLETLKMETLSQLAEPMSNVMQSLSELLSSDEGQAAINTVLGGVRDALNWISENQGGVVTAIEAIGIAFGALKVSESVLTFVKLASGLKGIFGGGSAATAGASAAASGGASAGSFWATGFVTAAKTGIASVAPWLLEAMGVTGVALTPALIAQGQAQQQWSSDYERRMAAAGLGGNNSWFIRAAAEALGTDGQTDFGSAYDLLMGLSARQNQQKAELYNVLRGSTTDGNDTWNLLNRFWSGEALDHGTIDRLLHSVTDAFANADTKPQVDIQAVVPEGTAEDISRQIGTVPVVADVITGGVDGEHANGIWSVPFDGYLARLHRGERVTPAREVQSRNYSSNMYIENMTMNNGQDADGLAARVAAENRRIMSGYGSN